MTFGKRPTDFLSEIKAFCDARLPTDSPLRSTRPLRSDLTPEEKERLEKYGAIEFKSAGAVRKK